MSNPVQPAMEAQSTEASSSDERTNPTDRIDDARTDAAVSTSPLNAKAPDATRQVEETVPTSDVVKPATMEEPAPLIVHKYQVRTWTSGPHSTKASFVSYAGGKVTLRKEDGSQVAIGVDQLSDEDQHYVQAVIHRLAR